SMPLFAASTSTPILPMGVPPLAWPAPLSWWSKSSRMRTAREHAAICHRYIACMPEIVGTFLRTELWDEGADGAVKAWDGSRCHFTQECLEFAVRHLDGIEVGRIFRQVTQCRAHCFDSPANAGPQMDPAVIHHDDVVASERRNQA